MATFTRFAGPNWEATPGFRLLLPMVDEHFGKEHPQHPMRRWEYASALDALITWKVFDAEPFGVKPLALDVGGAGSPFIYMLEPHFALVHVIDPEASGTRIEDLPVVGPGADALFSISVLEHVEDPYSFLEACVRHLRKGGLLFLTVDAWDPPVNGAQAPDTAHFHWMRKRIFTAESLRHTMDFLHTLGCRPFAGIDLEYKGNTVYDYTFASICMTKERS